MRIRLARVVGGAVLGLLVLGACGGGSEPLTTQEYADALVEAQAEAEQQATRLNEEIQEEYREVFEDLDDELPSFEAGKVWSEETAESASEFASRLISAQVGLFSRFIQLVEDYHGTLAGMRPPDHFAELHESMTAAFMKVIATATIFVEEMEAIDTSIETADEFVEFTRRLDSWIGDFANLGGDESDVACREIRARLETELGGNWRIC